MGILVRILRVVDFSYRALNTQEGENRTFEPAGVGTWMSHLPRFRV